MARLILFVTLVAGLALAAAAAVAALRSFSDTEPSGDTQTGLPAPLRMIAFVFLFLLTTGVSTGLLGAS
ncbi:hypothetical protein ACOI1H_02625 [Loktanella sp. DJP18]|uniref:hypothetical protein n=1 Tax=Loktanella sp. DJP18 TaxID=3409788 RepID=UPI003BB4B59A